MPRLHDRGPEKEFTRNPNLNRSSDAYIRVPIVLIFHILTTEVIARTDIRSHVNCTFGQVRY